MGVIICQDSTCKIDKIATTSNPKYTIISDFDLIIIFSKSKSSLFLEQVIAISSNPIIDMITNGAVKEKTPMASY